MWTCRLAVKWFSRPPLGVVVGQFRWLRVESSTWHVNTSTAPCRGVQPVYKPPAGSSFLPGWSGVLLKFCQSVEHAPQGWEPACTSDARLASQGTTRTQIWNRPRQLRFSYPLRPYRPLSSGRCQRCSWGHSEPGGQPLLSHVYLGRQPLPLSIWHPR